MRTMAESATGSRDPHLETRLRSQLIGALPPARIQDVRSSVISRKDGQTLHVAALVADEDGHHGVVAVTMDKPPLSIGEMSCLPPLFKNCSQRDSRSGPVVITDQSAPEIKPGYRFLLAELYKRDAQSSTNRGAVVMSVRAMDQPRSAANQFWDGGSPVAEVPLTLDQIMALVEAMYP
ncbi:hypothetical protein [Herbihabitans rhizosphaerae]|uniref:hypothetical protein n=1 Tax=Herbihabitans rhizosphaerae TaxID=1872711 RepID=UPI00102C9CD4|nr:hypothetical protein [Herbihabitans rhizosphaerae]